jgi:acetolactate synthase-1/2/3 large subunit
MKASDLFVKCLENEGVEYVFGIPGEENLDVMDSMIGSPIKFPRGTSRVRPSWPTYTGA